MKNNSSNIDPQEVAKFDALAANWWNPNGEMKPLHQLNPLRLAYIEKNANLMNQTVIDVGCGGGILSEALAKKGAQVTGIDMSEKALAIAKQHAERNQLDIHYQQIDIESFANQHPQQFDVVTCMELLEHVPDPTTVIQACAQLAKPKGKIFFSTINRNLKAFLSAIIGAEYLLQLLPKGTHHYGKFIRPSELNEWARHANLKLMNLQGISYHPFSGHFQLSDDLQINYLACFEKNEK